MLRIDDKNYIGDFTEVRKIDSTHISLLSTISGFQSQSPAIYHIAQLIDNENYNQIKSWLDSEKQKQIIDEVRKTKQMGAEMNKEINLTFDQDIDLQYNVRVFLNNDTLNQVLSQPKIQPRHGELISVNLDIEVWKNILNTCKLDSELKTTIKNGIGF